MSEQKALEILLDFANALEAAVVNVKRQIAELSGAQSLSWNPEKIKWEQAQGSKGPFERSEDVNSADFKALLTDLVAHQGSLTRDGWFYWVFKNGATVGRKKR